LSRALIASHGLGPCGGGARPARSGRQGRGEIRGPRGNPWAAGSSSSSSSASDNNGRQRSLASPAPGATSPTQKTLFFRKPHPTDLV